MSAIKMTVENDETTAATEATVTVATTTIITAETSATKNEIAFYPSSDPTETGNSTSNINNEGYAAVKGEWIYFLCEVNYDFTNIYKMKVDGTQRQKVN